MKRFIWFVSGLTVAFIIMMTLADIGYTAIYRHCIPRNKVVYIIQMKPTAIDRVFLGSSRVANHIVTSEVKKTTGKPAINLGIEGSGLADNLLQFKLLLDRKIRIKKLYLQVDYVYNDENLSLIGSTAALPFIKDPVVSGFLEPRLKNYPAYAHIPFYRYAMSDQVLGLRECLLSLANKRPKDDFSDGFHPQHGHHKILPFSLPKSIASQNHSITEFKRLCKKNSIEFIPFCAPYPSGFKNRDFLISLKKKLPELQDYSTSIPDSLFYNSVHLNSDGALAFTRLLLADEK
ncbi:hypothetical protein [Flavobacterium silvaticum]|uniref:Uncharacterized protein n=1 Tax=Flavobacterium silvaticum TaxID=1852020 RepID=A0A972FVN9_9FLAO|nr:hypothetical protein [Flavobacterium silvaticum]NMH29558.1 hypothetical protein [Flavobacterium silvaticum]